MHFLRIFKKKNKKICDRYGYVAKDPKDCDNTEKFAILLHGWRESCEVNWMQSLVKRITNPIKQTIKFNIN